VARRVDVVQDRSGPYLGGAVRHAGRPADALPPGRSLEVAMGWVLFLGVVVGVATCLGLLGSLASGRDRRRTASRGPERRVTTADPIAASTPLDRPRARGAAAALRHRRERRVAAVPGGKTVPL